MKNISLVHVKWLSNPKGMKKRALVGGALCISFKPLGSTTVHSSKREDVSAKEHIYLQSRSSKRAGLKHVLSSYISNSCAHNVVLPCSTSGYTQRSPPRRSCKCKIVRLKPFVPISVICDGSLIYVLLRYLMVCAYPYFTLLKLL